MNRVFREEKKYLIGMAEALQRSHLLGQVMREDPHNGVHGYRIRSLYFDTVYDEDYHEKLAGIETRRKIRLRCYDPAAGYAMLEMKQKQGASQLKRTLRPGTRLVVTDHCRPGCVGELREVTLANTQGFYSKILNPPAPRINAANEGRGSVMWWGAASTWSFEDGVCSSYMNQTMSAESLIMAFRVLVKEAA